MIKFNTKHDGYWVKLLWKEIEDHIFLRNMKREGVDRERERERPEDRERQRERGWERERERET